MTTYRNPRLLALAQEAPHCMYCGIANQGDVVACHSNSLQDGKGTGHKAHDIPAFLCGTCHDIVDGRQGNLPREERQAMLYRAVYRTWLWLMQAGKLQVAA